MFPLTADPLEVIPYELFPTHSSHVRRNWQYFYVLHLEYDCYNGAYVYLGGYPMTIFEKLKPIIADQLGVKMENIKLEASFKDDFEADSLDMVNLTMEIEDEFAIEISEKTAATLQTVGDVVKYIENR